MTGIERIAAERQRQISVEGWTPEHDAQHTDGSLAQAAACYTIIAKMIMSQRVTEIVSIVLSQPPRQWPWISTWWKPSVDPIRNLEKAGALIAAEIDRLQYVKAKEKNQ